MTLILVDFSQLLISAASVNSEDIKSDPDNAGNLIKHIAINSLLNLKKKFQGKLIICCDSKNYWRKEIFPYYKGHRKHRKDNGFLDWDMVHTVMNEIKGELQENFPYMVLEVDGAEADDIIGVLVEYFDGNELAINGLVEEPEDIVIASSDKDFVSLQKYKNVRQWSNAKQDFITTDNPTQYLIEKIVLGDSGDTIPSIVTGDWWSKARSENIPTRAPPFKKSRLPDFYAKGYDACLNEEEQRNYRRNESLIDLSLIPEKISAKIIRAYVNYEHQGNKKKVIDYFMKHRMKLLMAEINNF